MLQVQHGAKDQAGESALGALQPLQDFEASPKTAKLEKFFEGTLHTKTVYVKTRGLNGFLIDSGQAGEGSVGSPQHFMKEKCLKNIFTTQTGKETYLACLCLIMGVSTYRKLKKFR